MVNKIKSKNQLAKENRDSLRTLAKALVGGSDADKVKAKDDLTKAGLTEEVDANGVTIIKDLKGEIVATIEPDDTPV